MPDTSTEVALATTTLSSAATNITFSSIPGTYTDLVLILVTKQNTGIANTLIQFNSDTGTNYSRTALYGDGSTAQSFRDSNNTFINTDVAPNATNWSMFKINILSYAGSTNKTVLIEGASDKNGSGAVTRNVGLWRNTAAITSIKLFPFSNSYDTGTTATLYGIL